MAMGKKDLKSVLSDEPEMDEMESPDEMDSEYSAYDSELQELFGLDPEKAKRLRDVICGLTQVEMSESSSEDEEEEPAPPKKGGPKKGLAIVLGG